MLQIETVSQLERFLYPRRLWIPGGERWKQAVGRKRKRLLLNKIEFSFCQRRNAMPFQLPDRTTPFGQRVVKRLHEEPIIWLTTVDSKGTPQPTPVWFWWDEEKQNFLIYSLANAKRESHLRANPRVSLNFDGDKQGGDIIVFTGNTEFSNDPPADHHQPYVEKYREFLKRSFGTPENFAERYPVTLRIQPLSVRGY
jgi:PPOX class probable F420-dependent enzyme